MNRSSLPARRRPWALGLAGSLAVGGLVLAPTVGAEAAADPALCPPSYPTTELRKAAVADDPGTAVDESVGTPVTGLTSSGRATPDEITGTYVGTIEDAIGPGKDLLVFKLAGSRITHADGSVDAGIWAGMSGSPLYAERNGTRHLVGAVSYGFSVQSSDFAGVTPAADLRSVGKTMNGAARAAVPNGLGAVLRADGASAAAVSKGFRRLPVPRAVGAGIGGGRLADVARKSGFGGAVARAAGGVSASQTAYPIVPGGPIATSYSYGAVSFTGVGTVTAVCDQQVFAYGHPDSFTGPSTMTMHSASTVMVQADDTAGSSVIANVGRPAGQIIQDRTSGILGVIGKKPQTTTVYTKTTVLGEGTRKSVSHVSVADALTFAAYAQSVGEVDGVYDGTQRGTADVSWVITGKRAGNRPFSVTGTNKVADRYDISGVTGADQLSDLLTLTENDFEDVQITGVYLTTVVTPRYDAYRVGTVLAKQRGKWRAVSDGSRVKVKPGKRVRLRVSLAPQRGSAVRPRTVPISFKVPRRFRGQGLLLEVAGLADRYGSIEDEELVESSDEELSLSARSAEPTSLPGLLTALRGNERNDQLLTTLYAFDEELEEVEVVRQRTVRAASVVSGGRTLLVKVKR